jgi:hypothetical protein
MRSVIASRISSASFSAFGELMTRVAQQPRTIPGRQFDRQGELTKRFSQSAKNSIGFWATSVPFTGQAYVDDKMELEI